MSLKWTNQNIRLKPSKQRRTCLTKLNLTRSKEKWLITFNAFWIAKQSVELWAVGEDAKLLLKLSNVSGNINKQIEFKHLNWDSFFYSCNH